MLVENSGKKRLWQVPNKQFRSLLRTPLVLRMQGSDFCSLDDTFTNQGILGPRA